MKILLVNPPNCGRSIPEERYGIDSLKQILRGEPLALEVLAGNLGNHEVKIVDLKADPQGYDTAIDVFRPDIVGITGMTCEANTMLRLARQAKEHGATVVVGGIHASNDPDFFNRPEIDHIVVGLGKASFRELADALATGSENEIAGIARTSPGSPLAWQPRCFDQRDLGGDTPPRYDLVEQYRQAYRIDRLGVQLGFVASAYGCPYRCDFCAIAGQAGGRYLHHDIPDVIRDIRLLGDIPFIRLVDANTFGNVAHARSLSQAIRDAGIRRQFMADVRSDTVVRHPELMEEWKQTGLRAVVIGFEEISDESLGGMNKESSAAINREAVRILRQIGITIVGDFIVDPDYDEARFDALGEYLAENRVDLPMFTIMTPLPGTPLYGRLQEKICITDLDYYTLTNAVLPTRMEEGEFYRRYAELLREGHARARV